MLVAELGGPTMFARIGVMRALNRHIERVFKPSRKVPSLGTPQAGQGSMTKAEPAGSNFIPGSQDNPVAYNGARLRIRREAIRIQSALQGF
jgi:hypothetical protein